MNIFLLGLVPESGILTLFRILKSKGLAAGEEEDAGEEGDEKECAGFSDHLIKNMIKR